MRAGVVHRMLPLALSSLQMRVRGGHLMRMSAFIVPGLLGMTLLTGAAIASEQDEARALSRAGAIVPLEQITAQARKRDIRHLLEVDLESDDRGYYYEVEGVDAEGVVRKLRYDAATGELIGESVDD